MSRVKKIARVHNKYKESQLKMRLKVVLDQSSKDGRDDFVSFKTFCKWVIDGSIFLNTKMKVDVTYSIDIPITHDVFQGTKPQNEKQMQYEPRAELIEQLTDRNIDSVKVFIKEPLTLSFDMFDELLTNHQIQVSNHLMTFFAMRSIGRQITIQSYTLKNGNVIYPCNCEFDRVLMRTIIGYDESVRQKSSIISGDPALFYPQRIEVIK